jgi:hypothetical protein
MSSLHALFARQSNGGGSSACIDAIDSGCLGSSPTESSCRNAVCSNSCLGLVPTLSKCCDAQTSGIAAFENCVLGEIDAAQASITGTTAGASPTAPASTATTAVKTGGGERVGPTTDRLGGVGTLAAWALSLLFL